jgi:hypothetical protein
MTSKQLTWRTITTSKLLTHAAALAVAACAVGATAESTSAQSGQWRGIGYDGPVAPAIINDWVISSSAHFRPGYYGPHPDVPGAIALYGYLPAPSFTTPDAGQGR